MTFLIVLTMAVIIAALIWTWWSGRLGRDPAATVDHFHRALSAMSPEEQRRQQAADQESRDEDEIIE